MAAKVYKKRPLLEMLYFGVMYPGLDQQCLFVEKIKSVKSSKLEISYLINCLVWLKTA